LNNIENRKEEEKREIIEFEIVIKGFQAHEFEREIVKTGVQWETPYVGSFAHKNFESLPWYNFFFLFFFKNNNNNNPTFLHNFPTWVLYPKNCLHYYQP
jgi:hypothetical protein